MQNPSIKMHIITRYFPDILFEKKKHYSVFEKDKNVSFLTSKK